jgi:RimJ/RimL family protein N-acetyltransferase
MEPPLIQAQGYKYSVFNLVFANNLASIKIWDSLGFDVIGRVPGAGRVKNSEEPVDALIYGRILDV